MALLRISLTVCLPIALLLLTGRLLQKRFRPELKYWLWLAIALRLLIPISITLPEQSSKLPVVRQAVSLEQRYFSENQGNLFNTQPAALPAENDVKATVPVKAPIPWIRILSGIWLTGVVLYLIYYLLANYHFRRKLRRWHQPLRDREIKSMVLAVQRELGIRQKIQVIQWEGTASPLVTGLFFPVLILPMEIKDTGSLYYILRHELTHIKRHDIAYQAVLLLCSTLHWFNPLIHLMRIQALHDLEVSCDAIAVADANRQSRIGYSEAMIAAAISAANGPAMLTTAFLSSKKSLMLRFREIINGTSQRHKGRILLAAVVLALLLCGASVRAIGSGANADRQSIDQPSTADTERTVSDSADLQAITNTVYRTMHTGDVPEEVLDGFATFIAESDWFWQTCGPDAPYKTEWSYGCGLNDEVILEVHTYEQRSSPVPMEYYLHTIVYDNGTYAYGDDDSVGMPQKSFLMQQLQNARITVHNETDYWETARQKLQEWVVDNNLFRVELLYNLNLRTDAVIYWYDVDLDRVTLTLYYEGADGQIRQDSLYTEYWAYTCYIGESGPVTDPGRLEQIRQLWNE